ncbi:MAG: hypothetical protein ACYS9T_04425 [Planctomycetota bacterium]|jgi:drug/metabolite transporter (DMT)-like permease
MNRAQKAAWLGVAVSVLLLIAWAFKSTVVSSRSGMLDSFGLLAFLSLTGSLFVFLRRKQRRAEVNSDERDKLISRRALIATYFCLWCLLIAICVIPQFVIGQEHRIPLGLLPLVLLGIMIMCNLVYSAAILVQYGRGQKGDK